MDIKAIQFETMCFTFLPFCFMLEYNEVKEFQDLIDNACLYYSEN